MKVNVPLIILKPIPVDGWVDVNGWIEVDFVGATIGEMMADIERRYPGFLSWFPNGKPWIAASFKINGEEILKLQGVDTPVNEGDDIKLVSYTSMPWNN